jgi:hypothetical protein
LFALGKRNGPGFYTFSPILAYSQEGREVVLHINYNVEDDRGRFMDGFHKKQ